MSNYGYKPIDNGPDYIEPKDINFSKIGKRGSYSDDVKYIFEQLITQKMKQVLLKIVNSNDFNSLDGFFNIFINNPNYLIIFIKLLGNNPVLMQLFFEKLNSNSNRKAAIKFVILAFAYKKDITDYFIKINDNSYEGFFASLDELKKAISVDIDSIIQSSIPQKQRPMPDMTPKTVGDVTGGDVTVLWSPISYRGVVYEFDGGIIGIYENGEKTKMIFDGTDMHHDKATIEIGKKTNCVVDTDEINPFFLGMQVGKQGTIIVHLEGGSMQVYMPDQITQEQYDSLLREIDPRSNFSLTFTCGDRIYDDPNLTVDDLKTFLIDIVKPIKKRA